MSLRDRAMVILGDLVGFPTVTTESNLDLISYVADVLEPLGYDLRITHDETGLKGNLLATIGHGSTEGIILSGHSDVVPVDHEEWTGAPFVAMRRDQRIYGRGTVDMKGFISCCLALAPWFAKLDLKRPIHIAVTADEEIGCKGAPHLIADMTAAGIRPLAAIVGEPTGLEIVVAHKGMHEYTTTITGVEGHGSLPGQGVNAVRFGARFVTGLMTVARDLEGRARPDSRFDPPHTTINVGSMHGGTAHNIIAGECVIQWEMRPVSSDDATYALDRITAIEKELLEEMQLASSKASIETRTDGAVDGLSYQPSSPAVDLIMEVLGDRETHVVAFGTEAGLYQQAGIPAVVCGPGSIDVAHKANEYISLDEIERCIEMMKGLARTLLD